MLIVGTQVDLHNNLKVSRPEVDSLPKLIRDIKPVVDNLVNHIRDIKAGVVHHQPHQIQDIKQVVCNIVHQILEIRIGVEHRFHQIQDIQPVAIQGLEIQTLEITKAWQTWIWRNLKMMKDQTSRTP